MLWPLRPLISVLRTPRGLVLSLIAVIAAHAAVITTIPDRNESLVRRMLSIQIPHPLIIGPVILTRPPRSTSPPTILIPMEDSWDAATRALDANKTAPGSTVSIRLTRIRQPLLGVFAPWATRHGTHLWKDAPSPGDRFTPAELALVRDAHPDVQQRLDTLYTQAFVTVPMAPGRHTSIKFRPLAFTLDIAATLATLAAILASSNIHNYTTEARRARRLAKNLCPSCGYNAQGLATCPECGTRTNHPAAT